MWPDDTRRPNIRDHFLNFREMPADRRAAALGRLRRDDPERATQIETLLKGDAAVLAAGFLPDPEGVEEQTRPFPTLPPGTRVGPYVLVRTLAPGGMGIVYLAARAEDQEQKVALKVIGPTPNPDLLRRFHVERLVLAGLDQPNIVRMLDGGETEDGQPYLVMEFVDGGRLDDHCRRLDLPLMGRVRLFAKVARAIAYAHDRGVLHRDLKPANVLVTAEGEPRVTDFGLARPIHADPQSTTSGGILGTPAYMAPEQITRGAGRNTEGIDVYGLGALLYRLVADRHPFRGETPLQTCADVLRRDPTPVRRLQPDAPRDLETIVLKAMARDVRDRYASARDLADDLDRFLDHGPIRARRPSPLDRLGRWAQRHPARLTTWVLTVALLMGAGIALLTGFNRALVREREQLRQTQRDQIDLLREYTWSLERLFTAMAPGDLAYQKEARRFLVLSTSLAESSGLDEFRYLQALAHFHCARSEQGRDEWKTARAHYQASADMLRPLARSHPGWADVRYDLARSLICAADITTDLEEARPVYFEALRVCEAMCDDFRENLDYRDALANRLYAYGHRLIDEPDGHDAPEYLAQALAIAEDLSARPGARPSYLRNVILPLNSLCHWYHVRGDFDEAERCLDRALAAGEMLWRADPSNRDYRAEQIWMLLQLAELRLHAGRLDEAERPLERASLVAKELAREFPEARDPIHAVLETTWTLAELRYARGDLPSARVLFGEIVVGAGRYLSVASEDQAVLTKYLDLASATPFADQIPVDRILDASNALQKLRPEKVDDQGPKARALAAAGRNDEAVAMIEVEGVRLNSTFLLSVAAIEAQLGRMDEALAHYESATAPGVPGEHIHCFFRERVRREVAAALGLEP